MSTLSAIQKTIETQDESKAVKLQPNSSDTSLIDSKEEGVLIAGSNGTVSNSINAGDITIRAGSPNRLGLTGGDVNIISGTGPNLSGHTSDSGLISIKTGIVNSGPATTGEITLGTGTVFSGTTGAITLYTGGGTGGSSSSGDINIYSGFASNATGSISIYSSTTSGNTTTGSFKAYTGVSTYGASGVVEIYTGEATQQFGVGGTSGNLSMYTGNTTSGDSGDLDVYTGNSTDGGASGAIDLYSGTVNKSVAPEVESGAVNVYTGAGGGSFGKSGELKLYSGIGDSRGSGDVSLYSGVANGSSSGQMSIYTGTNANGPTGPVKIYTGDNDSTTGLVGRVLIYGGNAPNRTGNNRAGDVIISGGTANGSEVFGSSTRGGNIELNTYGFGNIKYNGYLHSMKSYGAGIQLEVTEPSYLNLYNGPDFITQASTPSNRQGWIGLVTSHDSEQCGDILLWNNDGGQIQLKTRQGNHTQSGNIDIETEVGNAGTSGSIDIKTGGITGGTGTSYSGSIEIHTGPQTMDSGNTGEITIRTGNASAGDSSKIEIKTGTGANSGDIEIITGASPISNTQRGEVKVESSSIPSANGTDKRIMGVESDGVLTAGHLSYDTSNIQGSTDQRLLTIQANGLLNALGLQVLGYGKISHSIPANSFLESLPVFFMNKTYNTGAAQDVNLSPNGSTPDNHNEVVEVYEGIRPLDESNSPSFTLAGIDLENLSIHITYHASANITVYQPHKMSFTVAGAVDGHRNVRLSWNRLNSGAATNANASGIHNNLLGSDASIVINYVVLHHSL